MRPIAIDYFTKNTAKKQDKDRREWFAPTLARTIELRADSTGKPPLEN